jgi:hypothetical protein
MARTFLFYFFAFRIQYKTQSDNNKKIIIMGKQWKNFPSRDRSRLQEPEKIRSANNSETRARRREEKLVIIVINSGILKQHERGEEERTTDPTSGELKEVKLTILFT